MGKICPLPVVPGMVVPVVPVLPGTTVPMEPICPGSTSPASRLPGDTALAQGKRPPVHGFASRWYAARACTLSSSGKACGSLLNPLYLELSAVLGTHVGKVAFARGFHFSCLPVTLQALEKVSVLHNTLVFAKLKGSI
eukprot:3012843-Amphidinium_carterae.1